MTGNDIKLCLAMPEKHAIILSRRRGGGRGGFGGWAEIPVGDLKLLALSLKESRIYVKVCLK